MTYLSIRALSMPTFLLLGVLQSALLGAKDSTTPLVAIGYSTIVNIVGDFLLVNYFGMGLKGAAIATTAAQWAATIALLLPARKKLMTQGKLGLLNFKEKSVVTTKQFMSFAAPVVTLLAGKLAVFGFLTQAAAKVPGQPVPLATHQIILSLFLFMCPFVEVINQTAQTFLPPFYAPVKEYVASMKQRVANYDPSQDAVVKKWNAASRRVSTGLLKSCFLIAAMVATAGAAIPMSLGHSLTRDVAVQSAMKPIAKFLWWSTLLMGPMSATEGILLARHKTWFLATMYMASTAVFPYALLTFGSGSIGSIWLFFSCFQAYRASVQTLKVTGLTPRKVLSKAANLVTGPFVHQQAQLA
jgi:Na+-driven multidrug efflux pump